MKCKRCNKNLMVDINGYGVKCWKKLSKTRRFWIKWLG